MKWLVRFVLGTLRGRLILSVAVVHAVMMALFVGDLTKRQRAMVLDRQLEDASALSQALALSSAGWIASDDLSGLQELVEVQRRYPEFLFAMLTDTEGRVLAATDKSRRGQYLLDLPSEPRQTVLSRTPALVDVAVPALLGERHVGWARVGIGQKAAGQKLSETTRSGVLYALAAILLGSVIAWLLGRRISKRLYAVQEAIDAVRSGDHRARAPVAGTDEAALMAREFNSMLDVLAERDAELRLSEERYRSLITKVQAAIVLHDGEGRVLSANPLAQRLLGLSLEQLVGKALADPQWHFVREDGSVLPSAEYPVSVVVSTRQPLRGEVLGVHGAHDTPVTWVLVNAEPELDDAGNLSRVLVSFVDITERKRAETVLHRLNRELRAISSCNQVLVRAKDEQGLVDDVCQIICDEAGYRMSWVGYAKADDAKTIHAVAWAGAESGYLEQAGLTWADVERGHGPSGTAIRCGESVASQDFATDPQVSVWREAALERGYRSSIALPLKDDRQSTFGILSIYSTEPNAFTPDETRLLEDLAGDLSFGIMVQRARVERTRAEATAEQERKAQVRFFESMDSLSRAMQKTHDLEQTMDEVLGTVLSVFGCDRVSLRSPCDPESPSWVVQMEKARAERPGLLPVGADIPMDPATAEAFRAVLRSDRPVRLEGALAMDGIARQDRQAVGVSSAGERRNASLDEGRRAALPGDRQATGRRVDESLVASRPARERDAVPAHRRYGRRGHLGARARQLDHVRERQNGRDARRGQGGNHRPADERLHVRGGPAGPSAEDGATPSGCARALRAPVSPSRRSDRVGPRFRDASSR